MSKRIWMARLRRVIAGGYGLYAVRQRVLHAAGPGHADALDAARDAFNGSPLLSLAPVPAPVPIARGMRGLDIDERGRRIAAFADKAGLVTMTGLLMIGATMLGMATCAAMMDGPPAVWWQFCILACVGLSWWVRSSRVLCLDWRDRR